MAFFVEVRYNKTWKWCMYQVLWNGPLGLMTLKEEDGHLIELTYGNHLESSFVSQDSSLLESVRKELLEYLDHTRTTFDIPYFLKGTPFQLAVWRELERIPYGKTITYGEIAKRLGKENAARAVGNACHCNPISILVPCHRVISASGNLTGYAGGVAVKERLMKGERNHVHHT